MSDFFLLFPSLISALSHRLTASPAFFRSTVFPRTLHSPPPASLVSLHTFCSTPPVATPALFFFFARTKSPCLVSTQSLALSLLPLLLRPRSRPRPSRTLPPRLLSSPSTTLLSSASLSAPCRTSATLFADFFPLIFFFSPSICVFTHIPPHIHTHSTLPAMSARSLQRARVWTPQWQ